VSERSRHPVLVGNLIAPETWCRQRWCRENPEAEHQPGDGCTCHGHGEAAPDEPPRLTRLTAKAWRLDAFACRTCGTKTRNMIEYPHLFLRCEPCAALNRWPRLGGERTH